MAPYNIKVQVLLKLFKYFSVGLGITKKIILSTPFYLTFKMRCLMIGLHFKFSTYPQQHLFGGGGEGGQNPQLYQKLL